MKNLLMELRYIFNELKDKNEIVIIYKYSCNAKRYTIAFTGKIIFINFVIIFSVVKYSHMLTVSNLPTGGDSLKSYLKKKFKEITSLFYYITKILCFKINFLL